MRWPINRLGGLAVVSVLVAVIVLQQSMQGQPNNNRDAKEKLAANLDWESLRSLRGSLRVKRAKVPGGWFVAVRDISTSSNCDAPLGAFYYPDPNHEWNGGSL